MAQANKLRKYKSLFSTTLSTSIGTGTSDTITLASVAGLPTDTEITLTIDRVDSNGNSTPSSMERITGIISGNNLTSYTRGVDGTTEQSHSAGAVVEMIWNADDWNDHIDHHLVEHNDNGTHSDITADTITTSEAADVNSLAIASGDAMTAIKDEDDMASNSATALATQQSIRGFGGFLIDGNYARDVRFQAKDVSVAADRYTLESPNRMVVYIGSKGYLLTSQEELDLSSSATWDTTSGTDYTIASNRDGKDFYIYACIPASGSTPDLLVSADASTPDGYTTADSLKIGGFHTLCESVGTISGHTLTGYVQGDILPQSVWDLKHRPISDPEGMVYDPKMKKWVDIYLASVSSGKLVSVNGGTIADGSSTEAFHWYKFVQWFNEVGKKLPDQSEFHSFSMGANQGTNISGSADPVTTGGHTDTAGRRMISDIGCEDTCGVLHQWGRDRGSGTTASSWEDAYDANDSDVAGQHYEAPNCARFGGVWSYGAYCGSRCSNWNNGPLVLSANCGARGVAEPV
jgi:hypothetical protein